MSEIILAETAGFCFGVTRAVDTAIEAAKSAGETIYTYGHLIHNAQVVEDLKTRKIVSVTDEEADKLPAGAKIIIRSHGIGRKTEEKLRAEGLDVIDATCPFVKKIHGIVSAPENASKTVIIVGDPTHPEVIGIRGWCVGESFVISDEKDAEKLPEIADAIIVSQTTFNPEKFEKIVEKIKIKCYINYVMNTICSATWQRQEEALRIARSVDVMIVVGDPESSNSQKLYSICKSACKNTQFVQSADELNNAHLLSAQKVGITAGASTPGNIIQEVLGYVRTKL